MSRTKAKFGTLSLAVLGFVLAMLFRISGEAAQSWALAAQAQDNAPQTMAECALSSEQLSTAMDLRDQKLAAQEIIMAEKEKALNRMEADLESRQKDLNAQEEKLRRLYAITDEAAEKDISKLVAIYEAMKPKDAAALFSHMDPKFAAGFLGNMKANEAAQILSNMPADYAYNISAVLASRNVNKGATVENRAR